MSQMAEFRKRMKAAKEPPVTTAKELLDAVFPPVEAVPKPPKAKTHDERLDEAIAAPKPPTPPKPKKVFTPPVIDRLPPGSRKILVWDTPEHPGVWHGQLWVLNVPKIFSCEESGEKGCFRKLHSLYVEWLAEQKGAAP